MFKNVFDFFVSTVVEDGSSTYYPTAAGNIALIVIVFLLFMAIAAFAGNSNKIRIKQLAISAMAVTLTVVTSFIKIGRLPYGGSITLFSMFFICLIGYLYGVKAGIIAGIAYAFIDLILESYIVHPVQLLLDYPIAFGCLGLAGVFANSKYGLIKGYIFGVVGRYLCHVISGYIFFSSYAPEGVNTLYYTLVYNVFYIAPEMVITIALLLIPPIQNALKQVKRIAIEE